MRALIIDTYYEKYINSLYYLDPELYEKSWLCQHEKHMEGRFGTSDAYSTGLKAHGIHTIEIVANSIPLQRAWMRDFQDSKKEISQFSHLLEILEIQVKWWKPDIVYVQDINWLPFEFIEYLKQVANVKKVVGQNACPLKNGLNISCYDLMLTSLPHYVELFKSMGCPAEYFPIGFDERLLNNFNTISERDIQASFVGGLSGSHSGRIDLINNILKKGIPLSLWGYGGDSFDKESLINKAWKGEAWAGDMYKILSTSKITINRHIEIANNFANNMRLYEATGMGACLVTDYKDNLSSIFEIDSEIVAYKSKDEAVEKIRYLIENPNFAKKIARAGQKKTLSLYKYSQLMDKLACTFKLLFI